MSKQMNTDVDTPPIPDGWVLQEHSETFSGHAGPFYFRKEGLGTGVAFFSKPHHANLGGVIHGGALLTLADMALWDICIREVGRFHGVTVTLNSEFVGPGPIGALIEAKGEPIKMGRNIMFARGIIAANDEPILTFSGTLKRLGPAVPRD